MKSLTIIKKLALSFLIVITLFLVVIIFSTIFAVQSRERQRYVTNYVLNRHYDLISIQNLARDMAVFILSTVDDPNWLANATSEEISEAQHRIRSSLTEKRDLGNSYIYSVIDDQNLYDILGEEAHSETIEVMNDVLGKIYTLYNEYIPLIDSAGFLENRPFEVFLDRFATPIINHTEHLRHINLSILSHVNQTLYDNHSRNMHFNIFALIFAIFTAVSLLFAITKDLSSRILLFKEKVIAIEKGDFNISMDDGGKDELSQLSVAVSGMIDTFNNLISQITYVSNEINSGNIEARVDFENFLGSYKDAAIAINGLAKEVMDSAYLKAESEYYEYIQFMMDTVPLVISFWNDRMELVGCNDEVLRRYKIDSKEQYLEQFMLFSPPTQPDGQPSREKAIEFLKQAYDGEYLKFSWVHQDIEGNLIPSEITCYKAKFMGNDMIVSYCEDMRDFYKALEEARRSDEVEENARIKARFLARMSHEIRTPISVVLGISEIQLQNPSLPPYIEEAFAKIYSSSQALLRIINDILDLSKIEAEKVQVLQEDYETASLINDVVQLNIFRLGSKDIKFNLEIDDNIPIMLKGDELRVKQVMNNLLSNAFKYTEEGSVNLVIKFIEDEEKPRLHFTLSDTGYGMSEEELDTLFEEFARFGEERSYHIEGVGLGMPIVNSLIKLMDGNIEVESEVGAGTTFRLEIPQAKASDTPLGKELAQNLADFKFFNRFSSKQMLFTPEPMPYGKVLVVDDVDTNLYVAKGLLSFYGIKTTTCESGYEALELVKKGATYDIIFLDHMMPGMDGIETLEKIRECGYTLPIVSLTANALIGQSEMFMEAGFDGFISKPIDTSRLNATLNKFIRDRQPTEIIEKARKDAEESNKEKKGQEAWEFFSSTDQTASLSEFLDSLRGQFAKSQRSAISDIRKALKADDVKSARRFAHTLKGLALTIKENKLAQMAAKLENIFEHNEIDENTDMLINETEVQLNSVLQSIPIHHAPEPNQQAAEIIEPSELAEILDELAILIKDDNAEALEIAEKLENIPQAAVLIKLIENFDFERALDVLSVLKEIIL